MLQKVAIYTWGHWIMLKCLSRGTVGLQINNIFTNIRHDVIDHYYSLFQDFSYLPSVL